MLPALIGTMIGSGGLQVAAIRDQLRTTPRPGIQSAGEAAVELQALAKQRVRDLGADSDRNKVAIVGNVPTGDFEVDKVPLTSGQYAGHARTFDADGAHTGSRVSVNPNLGSEALAHELGHHVTDQTKIGNAVRGLRNNPKLATAMGGAVFGLPLLQSSLQEGDDDFASGLAIASLMASPVLIDEALATKNGLALLKAQGRPATAGQRTRLAGGYLSYASAPLVAAMMGNAMGNVADDYTGIYNLGNDTGELPM